MHVICSDGSDEMLKLARQRLAYGERGYAQADFARRIDYELAAAVDAVVSARAIHNLRKLAHRSGYGQIHELPVPAACL